MHTHGLTFRPMTPADIPRACELALEAGWRSRKDFYELALRLPSCQPLVGEVDGAVVATGVATVSGRVGWVGTIVVALDQRGRGLGRAMTEAVMDRLREAGCETFALIATELGRPLYEKLGFRVQSMLHLMQSDRLPDPPEPPAGSRIHLLEPVDLPSVFALDASATGEDRRTLLTALAANGGRILERDGELRGYWLPSDRGYGPVIASDRDDGLCLLDVHRHMAREGGFARAAIPDENEAGWRALASRGWHDNALWPRMILGADVAWKADWIWGQINFAMG